MYIIATPLSSSDIVQNLTMTSAVTLNLPTAWWAYAIKAGYCVALMFSYPFMFAPAVAICEKALVPKYLAPVVRETHGVWRRNCFRACLVTCTLLVSLAGAQQLNNFVSLIGAFCCGARWRLMMACLAQHALHPC